MALPSVQEMEAYIRQAAQARGIDPDIAIRVARSEGLAPGVWQATGMLDYGRERSYGPFQLHVDPRKGKGGMGNDMLNQTGIDPSDPANWKQGVDFALDNAAKGGWSPWMGAAKEDITGMMGINNGKAIGVTPAYSAGPGRGSMAGYRIPRGYAADGSVQPGVEKTFYDDRSPALPGNQGQGVGASLGGFSGGMSQVAARNPNIQTAGGSPPAAKRTAYSDMMQRSLEKEGRPQREIEQMMGQMQDGSGRNPLGGILDKLRGNTGNTGPGLDAKLAGMPQDIQNGLEGGILGKLFKLFS